MIKWLLRTWHRFTLASTTQRVIKIGYPGSVGALAGDVDRAARASVPLGIRYEVVYRQDSSLKPGTIRIAIESGEP